MNFLDQQPEVREQEAIAQEAQGLEALRLGALVPKDWVLAVPAREDLRLKALVPQAMVLEVRVLAATAPEV